MCPSETSENKQMTSGVDKRTRERGKVRGSARIAGKGGKGAQSPKPDSAPTSAANLADEASTSSTLLSACLDIFVKMAKNAPENAFLKNNSDKVTAIFAPCFIRLVRHEGDNGMRQQLKEFLRPLLADGNQDILDEAAIVRVKVLLERLIVEAAGTDPLPPAPVSGQKGPRDRSASWDGKGPGASSLVYFSVDLIEKASASSPEVVETFAGGLLGLAES